ncbi:MAG TPA: hypothetical protein VFB22_10245 [Candidatus Baltobacteraceae bacterium]|nr:hypothetical protein [Candidatus Baltobacteraceae bacterium]
MSEDDPTWKDAASVMLDTDFNLRRPAGEMTKVYIGQEDGHLDVMFVATQKEPLFQAQVTNGSGVLSDDYVQVELAPQGTQGFAYTFSANPRGARFQTSSENSAYAPQWSAAGTHTATGYVVTMRIPLQVMRGGGSTTWRAQFVRYTQATNALAVWAYSARASQVADATFFGSLDEVGVHQQAATRPKPRVQPYLLGELGAVTGARLGLDASIPISPTASFVTSLHPDYSNVEVDQQTIAPTAFPRQYTEVRPFFTQVASSFDNWFSCGNCPVPLYTPAIPTFSQGYAVEGTQGPLTFAAYDALGTQRIDEGEALAYSFSNPGHAVLLDVQGVGVDTTAWTDHTTTLDTGYLNQISHFGAYVNTGQDRGTFVTTPQLGNYFEGGPFYAGTTLQGGVTYQKIGAQFDPQDGYVQQTNVAGYEAYARKIINFAPRSAVQDVFLLDSYTRQWNDQGALALTANYGQLNVDFKNLVTIGLSLNNEGVRSSENELLPFDGSGFLIGYRLGKNQANGSSTTTSAPTYVQYSGGPYYHGKLGSWVYRSTVPVAKHFSIAFEADEDRYETSFPGETSTTQWLERVSLDWQVSRYAQFDLGARRIVGSNLPNSFQSLSLLSPGVCFANPYYAGCLLRAGNVSAAFHFLAFKNEFYAVYGDPDALTTSPTFFLKWIRYIGAEKGT